MYKTTSISRIKSYSQSLMVVLLSISLTACIEDDEGASSATPEQPYSDFINTLPGNTLFPADNEYSDEKRELGELLFWDPILSGDLNVSCASCHHPEHGWADGIALSIGVDGEGLGPLRTGEQKTPVNAPTIMNTAYTGLVSIDDTQDFVSGPYFWDLRAETLEKQATGPIHNPVEMRGANYSEREIMQEVLLRLNTIPEYVALFESAFGYDNPVTEDNLAKAIATFERTVNSGNSRFDDFMQGNESALSDEEIIGLNKFINAGCTRCHSGPMLADNLIHEDQPVVTGKPAVRTPSLRNISKTAPYMHDGSRATLRDAIAIYEERSDLQVTLEDEDFADIERFLRTMDDDTVYSDIPNYVPSGLPVGGDIQ